MRCDVISENTRENICKWRDDLYRRSQEIDVIRAVQEKIRKEVDRERLKHLYSILAEEYERQGSLVAARDLRRRDVTDELCRWHEELKRTREGAELTAAIEERIESESDVTKRQALGYALAYEYREQENYEASEATYLRLFQAEADDPFPLIQLAEQKLYTEDDVESAMRIIDWAIEVAYNSRNFRRNALTVKARIAQWNKDYQVVEDTLRQLMRLDFKRGDTDTGIMRDFFDRLPPGSIDPELARQYDEYCRANSS